MKLSPQSPQLRFEIKVISFRKPTTHKANRRVSEEPSVVTMCGCITLHLEGDLLSLEPPRVSPARRAKTTTAATTRATTATSAATTAATTKSASKAATATTTATTTAATSEATLSTGLLTSVVKTHSTRAPALSDIRAVLGIERGLGILNRVERNVAKALAVTRFPIETLVCVLV